MTRPRLLDLLPDDLAARIVVSDDCWEWTGWHNNLGYGHVRWGGRDRPIHRVVMELLNRVAPDQDVDHLCRNPGCTNPEHLEGVSHRENILRGRGVTKTHCKRGHPRTPENTYTRKNGRHWCAACAREGWRRG